MKIDGMFGSRSSRRVVAALGFVMAVAAGWQARADIKVYDNEGWSLSFDGRTAGFYSFEKGDSDPHFTDGKDHPMNGALVWNGFIDQPDQDPNLCTMGKGLANGSPCTFTTSRIHSGFVGNFFGLTTKHRISENTSVTGRITLWWPIETDLYRGFSSMSPDPRDSYVKLEGKWGGLLAGRTLGLHDRGGTLLDYFYANGNSIGSPCNATQQGPLCGHIGYGYQFPGYNAGILYNTPLTGGFQLTAGIYDPARVGIGMPVFNVIPYPRIESEATYTLTGSSYFFTAYVNGLWQQASGYINGVKKTVQAVGVSYGFRLELGGLKIGAGGNYDIGGGDTSGLVGPVPLDDNGTLRKVSGYMGQLMYSFGKLDLSGGAGVTLVEQNPYDITIENSVIKSRLGENLTINYHLDSSVVLNAQYFRAQHIFWRGQVQAMNFVHSGVTFVW